MKDFLNILIELPIAFLFLVIVLRVMGNKELKQATPIDFSFMVLSISIVWDMSLTPDYEVWQTCAMLVVVALMIFLIDKLTQKSHETEKILIGEPILLIENGEIKKEAMEKERMSIQELEFRLRLEGYFEIDHIELCYLEFNGEISVKKKEER